MTNSMFSNEATDAVHQVLMLGGETRHSIAHIQKCLQDAYNLGTENPSINALKPVFTSALGLPAAPPVAQPVAPVAPAHVSEPVVVSPVETPAELVAEMTAFVKKGKK